MPVLMRRAGRPPIWWDARCRVQVGSPFAGSPFAQQRVGFARAIMLGLAFAEGAGYDEARRLCTFSGGDVPLPNQTIARWYSLYRRVVARA